MTGLRLGYVIAPKSFVRPMQKLHQNFFISANAMVQVAGIAALLQPLSGDLSARHVARHQPVKLAAMEGQWETQRGAPLRLGGWPDAERQETRWAVEIPRALSLLAFGDADAEVRGLKSFPPDERPPVAVVHAAFELMVAIGGFLAVLGLVGAGLAWRARGLPDRRWYLALLALSTPLGFIAIEAGWTVTEVGRQPWVIHGILRTADAVTPMPGLTVTFTVLTLLYLVLSVVVFVLMRRQVFASPAAGDFAEEEE